MAAVNNCGSTGFPLPKFNGDIRFWPSFLTIFRRQTHECQFNQSENMQRLRDALKEPAKSCVEMLLLTDDAERVMSKLKQNFGNTTAVIDIWQEDIKLFPDVHDSSQLLRFSNLVENIPATVIVLAMQMKPITSKFFVN
jgi:putative lipase involved disintegration of autophagic bodies